jgi:predicted aspartyl protease
MANGQHVLRDIGYAIIRCGEFETIDEVVFAQPGDLQLVGARTLKGFNATIDRRRKRLVAAGPMPAA